MNRTNGATKLAVDATSFVQPTSNMIAVVYVSKHNAKVLKTELERLQFLDKRFRMTPVERGEGNNVIAAPITEPCLRLLSNVGDSSLNDEHASWMSLVKGTGTEEMPWSTSQFAKKNKKNT